MHKKSEVSLYLFSGQAMDANRDSFFEAVAANKLSHKFPPIFVDISSDEVELELHSH